MRPACPGVRYPPSPEGRSTRTSLDIDETPIELVLRDIVSNSVSEVKRQPAQRAAGDVIDASAAIDTLCSLGLLFRLDPDGFEVCASETTVPFARRHHWQESQVGPTGDRPGRDSQEPGSLRACEVLMLCLSTGHGSG